MTHISDVICEFVPELKRGIDESWWKKLAYKSYRSNNYRIIPDREFSDIPYLVRFYIHSRFVTLGLFRAVIHRFCQSDKPSEGTHSHPWGYISYILDGGYIEHFPNGKYKRRYPGELIIASSKRLHRIELHKNANGDDIPCWTLFIMGPRVNKDWGFLVDDIYYPHMEWFKIRKKS